MKKILLATSALALTASAAAAEVNASGSARFGINYVAGVTWMEKRMTINLDASGEADNGWSYGGRIRIRSDEFAGTGVSGAEVHVSAGGFTISAGNINGAIEMMPGLYSNNVGLTGLAWDGVVTNSVGGGYWGWDAFSSRANGPEGVRLTYSANGFTGHVSRSWAGANTAASGSYTFGDWTIALGHQFAGSAGGQKTVGIVSGNIGDFSVTAGAANNAGSTKFSVGGAYSFGATTVNAYITNENGGVGSTYGLGVAHNLGGITVAAGVANVYGTTMADLGVKVSF